ncbi:MAG: hypothetical protein ABSE40_02855 [Candidatus Sulfotelmatobacter sp.]|jgi:hypothetical protein
MSGFVQETQQEFWRPPSTMTAGDTTVQESIPAMAEVCAHCGTEFLLGSHFCHCCGRRRPNALSATAKADAAAVAKLWDKAVTWTHSAITTIPWSRMWRKVKSPAWLHYLHFHEIQRWVGLTTASLIAFVIGLGCVAGALLVGLITAKTLVDWQAIQFYRVEWLLAATASFVAAILLKKPSGN